MDTWADFEMAMAEYAKKHESEQTFLECVTDFAGFLKSYLGGEARGFEDKLKLIDARAIDGEIKESIEGFYKGITNNFGYWVESKRSNSFNEC